MDIDLILSLYNQHKSGIPIVKLAKDTNIHRETIRKWFKTLGLNTVTKLHIYDALFPQIQNMYLEKKSIDTISKTIGISKISVWRVLKLHGIKPNKKYDYESYYKTPVNEYFDQINTSNKAYFLGFLYADGNVHSRLNHVTLKLKQSDVHILNDLKSVFGIGTKIYYQKKYGKCEDQVVLKIINKKIRDNFIRHGVIPRKTWKLKFPYWLDNSLKSHFIRGYCDGDGCLYIDKKRNCASICICGTEQMCTDLQFIIKNYLGMKSYVSKDRNIFRVRIRRYSDVVAFCEWMYKDAELFLCRKYEKFQAIKQLKGSI